MPAYAGMTIVGHWMPACAGITRAAGGWVYNVVGRTEKTHVVLSALVGLAADDWPAATGITETGLP